MTRLTLAAAFLLPFAVLLATMHPGYPPDDSPETIAACANLGIQHMPGYPAVTLPGRLAVALPVGAPSLRVNVLAAALGGGCAAACAATVMAIAPGPGAPVAGMLAGWMLALSDPAWRDGGCAKGAVYLLNLLCILLVVNAIVSRRRAGLPAAALAGGLGLAGHWMGFVAWLPGLALAFRRRPPRDALLAAGLALLGASLYLQLPLSVAREPSWGDPAGAGGLASLIARRDFLPQTGGKTPALTIVQLGWNALHPVRAAGLPFVLLALAGGAALWRGRRDALGLLGGGWLLTLLAVAGVASPVHRRTGELVLWFTEPFLLPALGASAVMAGVGLLLLLRRLPAPAGRLAFALAAVLPLAAAAGRTPRVNHARDYLGPDYARNLLAGVPPRAVVLAEADFSSWPLYMETLVERREPAPTLVMTRPFLERAWGWRRLAARLPDVRPAEAIEGPPGARIEALADLLLAKGTAVFHHPSCTVDGLKSRLALRGGLLRTVLPAGRAAPPADPAAIERNFARMRLRGLYAATPPRDETALTVLEAYAVVLAQPAEAARTAGRIAEALEGYRRAARLPGLFGLADIQARRGLAAALLGLHAEAAEAFAAAAALRPGNTDLWKNLAAARARQQETSSPSP